MNHKHPCNTKQQVVGILWVYALNFLATNGLLELRGSFISQWKANLARLEFNLLLLLPPIGWIGCKHINKKHIGFTFLLLYCSKDNSIKGDPMAEKKKGRLRQYSETKWPEPALTNLGQAILRQKQ